MSDKTKDFENLSPEVAECIRKSSRQLRYFTYDLKAEKIEINEETETVTFIPSREDSYDRLLALGNEFTGGEMSVEDSVLKKILLEKLNESLKSLTTHELMIVQELFFEEKSERELAKLIAIPQKTINDRKNRALRKLRKLLEE